MGQLDTVKLRIWDQLARELLRRRSSTVFAPPSRPLLAAARFTPANQ